MRYSKNIILLSILFIIFTSNVQSTEDIVLMENYIKHKLFCENTTQNLEMSYIHTHYYELTRTRMQETAPSSVLDIMKSGSVMMQEFKLIFESQMKSFLSKYMNIEHYISNFKEERFNPYNNLVMGSLRAMTLSNERFIDWISEEDRLDTVQTNLFTSTISNQKSLIVEFENLKEIFATMKKNVSLIQGTVNVDTKAMFAEMKTETIDYLALIFLTAFEHDSNEEFSSTDRILELYWANFYEWLELSRCERLVNGAYNGALDKITNIDSLREFLHSNQTSDHLDQIKLKGDLNEVTKMGSEVSDINSRLSNLSSWDFFTVETVEKAGLLSGDIEVSSKVRYDVLRLKDREHCLETIKYFKNFLDMKTIYKNKQKYSSPLEYYYLIEYFLKMINDKETIGEFPDDEKRIKAIQVIYLFINRILLTEQGELNKLNTFGKRMAYIIIRILTELDGEGTIRYILKENVLDDETELYIYKLFIFLTEKVNLPKPDESDELNKGKKKKVVEDNEEDPHVRINPQNPRFRKVIDRFYYFADKPTKDVAPWVIRFKVKYFEEMMVKENVMFSYDERFFVLEKKMAKEFEENYDFKQSNMEYIKLRIEYMTLVKGVDTQGKLKPVNESIKLLTKYYVSKIINWVKEAREAKKTINMKIVQEFVDETLLSHFGQIKSNMIEKEYFKTILFCIEQLKKSFKGLKLPDFKKILVSGIHVNDRGSLFEYMKRIMTNINYNKRQANQKLVDTLDINTNHFDDKSGIRNGERFRTLLLDVTEFFEPELAILKSQHVGGQGGQISYQNLEDIITSIKTQILPKDPEQAVDLENFRLMMQWNLFDDITEYLPLSRTYLEDTKTMSDDDSPMKMSLLIENYTNLYFAMVEHRLFCAEHKFSFEGEGSERLRNMLSYLKWRNQQYEDMLANTLPEKEVRYSSLNVREIQNLIYFLTFRLKVINNDEDAANIKITEQYFPYSFREIYMLSSNHSELITIINEECKEIFSAMNSEKVLRLNDISKGDVTAKYSQRANFNFCVLYKFNIDMIELVESRGQKNQELTTHQLTITRDDIFNDLIAPYYDKLSPLHMVIQVFNLNMNHASISANQTASTFSSYITLLDYFFLIIDDLKDGVNDSLTTKNLVNKQVNTTLVKFCQSIDNTASEEDIKKQYIFIRTVLLERLRPSFVENGPNLREIFSNYTKGHRSDNVDEFVSKITYGRVEPGQKYDYNPEGTIVDFRLISLLMIYAPHSEFTVNVIHKKNMMSILPKLIMNAKENEGFIFKELPKENNMNEVYTNCKEYMMTKILATEMTVDDEAEIDFESGDEFDLDIEGLENDIFGETENKEFEEKEVVVSVNTLDSNIVTDQETKKVLINVIDKVTEVIIDDNEDDSTPIINEHFIEQSSQMSEDDNSLLAESERLSKMDNETFIGINIRDSRENSSILSLEGKDISSKIDSNNNKHIVISNKMESVDKQITNSIVQDSVVHNAQFMINFKSPIFNDAQNLQLLQQKQQLLQKITNKVAQDLIKNKAKNGSVAQAQVVSVKQVSHRISMDTKSRLEESVEEFNDINKKLHFTGSVNNQISYSVQGQSNIQKMRSVKDNSAYSNAIVGNLKTEFQDLINKKLQQIKPKSKSYNGNDTSKPNFGVPKRGKTFNSTKFIRLV